MEFSVNEILHIDPSQDLRTTLGQGVLPGSSDSTRMDKPDHGPLFVLFMVSSVQ